MTTTETEAETAEVGTIDMKLEVVTLPVSDVDRAKRFWRSYFAYASFSDPDGNSWLLQEITTRLPGREWDE
jgi:hypothetical protein